MAESESGLFQGMIFCITSIDGDRKLQLKSMIETNGVYYGIKKFMNYFCIMNENENENENKNNHYEKGQKFQFHCTYHVI